MSDLSERQPAVERAEKETRPPEHLKPDLDGIPAAMKAERRWVTWRYERRKETWTKVPVARGRSASSTDPSTWMTFDEAAAEYRAGGRSGIGFVLGDGWAGVDVDKCLTPDGTVDKDAKLVLDQFETYREVSPSGTGVKAIFMGHVARGRKQNHVEVYEGGRYFTVTGKLWGDVAAVADCQDAADWLVKEWFDHEDARGPVVKREYHTAVGEALADEVRDHLRYRSGTTAGRDASGACLRVAADVVHGFELDPDDALALLMEWAVRDDQRDERGKYYPWDEWEMAHKIKSAVKGGCDRPGGPGWLLPGWALDERYGDQIAAMIRPFDSSLVVFLPVEAVAVAAEPFDPAKHDAVVATAERPRPRLLRWSDLKKIAASQQDRWLVKDVLEPGTLTILSGLPYSGKTTVLAHLMGCLATGRDWLGFATCQQCPLLFVNADRLRERVVVRRVGRALAGPDDDAAFEKVFFSVPVEDIPITLTPKHVANLMAAVEDGIGATGGTGLVVIDPLRAAFLQEVESGGENDSTTMTRVLSPLRKLARMSNWSIIVPHHNNRGRDQYAGTAAIAGNTDGLWNISRDDGGTTSRLGITTRDGTQPLLEIIEDEGGLRRADTFTPQKPDDITAFISKFPAGVANSVTKTEALKLFTDISEPTFRRLVTGATAAGRSDRLEQIGGGTKTNPFRYFRP